MPKQQQQPGQFESANLFSQSGMDIGLWVVHTGAEFVRPIINRRRGEDAQGLDTLIAFLTMPVLSALIESPEMATYWQLWTVCAVWRKLTPDKQEISSYVGRPPGQFLLGPRWARAAEPFLVIAIAHPIAAWSEPVGNLVAFGGLCMAFQAAIWRRLRQRRERAMRNARLEAGMYQ